MKLPTWREASWRVSKGFSTESLEEFIFKYEPIDETEKEEWRVILYDILIEERQRILKNVESILVGGKNGNLST